VLNRQKAEHIKVKQSYKEFVNKALAKMVKYNINYRLLVTYLIKDYINNKIEKYLTTIFK